tara:strand:+ start:701 stop:1036 length:336 start_codon:yes stop_codon:yes gene_type:complete
MIVQYIMDKIMSLKANAFDGVTYQHERDFERLKNQSERILNFISDGEWTTLREIAAATGAPEASISAKLRDLRKAKYGGHTVDRRYEGNGVYQYRFIFNGTTDDTQETLGF